MNDLDAILARHKALYPKMQAQDMMKLVYQRVFGCGHLVTDFDACIERLRAEYDDCITNAETLSPLGNGFARLHICNARRMGVSPWLIARLFYLCAERKTGTPEEFLAEAEYLKTYADPSEIDALIAESKANSFAPFSHSQAYHDAYHPAYRVVDDVNMLHVLLMSDMKQKSAQKPIVVGIDGRCGAGKSTLAALISRVFDCPVIHMDDFFLPPELRTPERLFEIGGNVHMERFKEEIIPCLKQDKPFDYGVFDCGEMAITHQKTIPPCRVIVVEGTYSLHPQIDGLYDIKVFVDIDKEEQLKRLAARDPERLNAFVERWIPMEERYFSALQIRAKCDQIL